LRTASVPLFLSPQSPHIILENMSSKTEVKKTKEAKESKEEKKRKVEEEEEDEEEDEEKRSPSNPDVVTKYRAAGDIANRALQFVQKQCVDGKRIVEICEAGDKFIMDEVGKIYNNKKIEKGLGFPTCISVNNTVGHFSPLKEDQTKLKNGDIVKMYVETRSLFHILSQQTCRGCARVLPNVLTGFVCNPLVPMH
jgi:hypothetical protein